MSEMNNLMTYQDFVGSVVYSASDRIFHGKIEFVVDLVTFEGSSVEELEQAFKEAVDDYIALCEELGKSPEKAFAGTFNVRMKPELHRKAAIRSLEKGVSLNQFVNEAVTRYVSSTGR